MTLWSASVHARFDGFELEVELEGDAGVLAVVGPNGSGKTTLLRVLAGAIRARRAEFKVDNLVLESSEASVRVPMEERNLGYVPQGYGLFEHLSALENVAFGLSTGARKLPRAERHARARELLSGLGCEELAVRRISRLSGGEKQRVALARALVIEPQLLLLDEPLAALDAITRRQVRAFLAERLGSFGRPSLLVTHDVRDVIALSARVCVLEAGRVVQCGSVDELRQAPATEFVAEFIGD